MISCDWWKLKHFDPEIITLNFSGSVYKVCISLKNISCLDLSPISKLSHYIFANISKAGNI